VSVRVNFFSALFFKVFIYMLREHLFFRENLISSHFPGKKAKPKTKIRLDLSISLFSSKM
jgi:hypothetical protein